VADLVPFENDVIDTAAAETVTHRQTGLPAADHDHGVMPAIEWMGHERPPCEYRR
jgi:hypothetical protein